LIIIGIIILLGVYFFLPESKKPDPAFSLKPGAILKFFSGIVKHPQFYTYALTGTVSYVGLYAYISASAMMGAIQMSIGAFASAMVSIFKNDSPMPMTGAMACSSITALRIFYRGRKVNVVKTRMETVEEEDVEMISTL
jgi:hypothetical protein